MSRSGRIPARGRRPGWPSPPGPARTEILLTSIEHDGAQRGFDCALTAAVAEAISIPVIASGGGGSAADFIEVLSWGRATAALAASIFHDGRTTATAIKRELAAAGIGVRPDGQPEARP